HKTIPALSRTSPKTTRYMSLKRTTRRETTNQSIERIRAPRDFRIGLPDNHKENATPNKHCAKL
ncbi:hypothetical protein KEJ32_02345, partial [Candidatus Bathyarchaeota archaeon]|nr:hypothetical protein [Candidatus Bathyarchaeota archaeon]